MTLGRSKVNPSWRSSSMSKKSSPPTISLVFAEPQHSTLASAVTKLPTPRFNDSNSVHDSKRRDFSESTSILQDEHKLGGSSNRSRLEEQPTIDTMSTGSIKSTSDSTSDHGNPVPDDFPVTSVQETMSDSGDTAPVHSESSKSSSSMNLPPSQTVEAPFPAPEEFKPSQTVQPLPSRSWFGSLSRPRGKEDKTVSANEERTQPTPTIMVEGPESKSFDIPLVPPSVDSLSSPLDAPTSPTPSLPQQIPTHMPQKRSWFSSSPASTSHIQQAQSTSPPLPHTPKASSIDEEVPKLSVKTPPPSPSINLVSNDGTHNPNLSSLNPSSSRFTLSLPLLGRPKVPLDQLVAQAQSKQSRNAQSIPSSESAPEIQRVVQSNDSLAPTSSTPQSDKELSNSDQLVASTLMGTKPQLEDRVVRPVPPASSTTWWSYVGWSSEPSPGPSSTGADAPREVSELRPAGETVPPYKESLSSPAQPLPEPESEVTQAAKEKTEEPAVTPHHEKSASILSVDGGPSSWYAPWTWYTTSSPSAPAGANNGPSTSEPPTSGDAKTDSERVKEEALNRTDVMSATPDINVTSPEVPTTSDQEDKNPIAFSIATHSSGWASFFSSRSLTIKTVANGEKEQSHMEVMNIDDYEEEAGYASENSTSKVINPKQIQERLPRKPLKSPPPSPKSESTNPKDHPPPLTNSDSVKRASNKATEKRKSSSPSPSKKSVNGQPPTPKSAPPNLVLPTWGDTFHAAPRSVLPAQPTSKLTKAVGFISNVLFAKDDVHDKGKGKAINKELRHFGKELPRARDLIEYSDHLDVLQGAKNVVVIGIHGWFPGAVMRTVLGEPTGTSSKFVSMMVQALEEFETKHQVKFEKVTRVPLEGDGTIDGRVDKLYQNLLSNKEWLYDLHAADVIMVATHSQGSIVSTHLLDRLIRDGHIRTSRNGEHQRAADALASPEPNFTSIPHQRICCLALCGIHLGPLRYLSTSSLLQPYIQYFESVAARELFEFQDTDSKVSQEYVAALRNVVHHGTKMVYVASLNDQVVPLYSGLFTCVSHPLILRALYIDGDAYHSSDFLSNLLILLLRVMNSGLSDSGLLAHLSEATAGSLNGVGHSTAYEELATYSLAVNYLFLTNDGFGEHPELIVEPFNATNEQNDYEIPWALRDLIADERVSHFFSREITELRDAFFDWRPRTTILRDIKRKLQPIQRLPSAARAGSPASASKL